MHFRQVLKIAPNHVGACQGLSSVLRQQGDPLEAIRFAKLAARLTGHQNPEVLIELGEAYSDAGRYADATAAAGKAFDVARATSPVMAAHIRRQMEQWRSLAKKTQP